jgi:hypothetical protein
MLFSFHSYSLFLSCSHLFLFAVGVRLIGEDKLLRKKVGDSAAKSCDPQWHNAKFSFPISANRLSELVLQVKMASHLKDIHECVIELM